MTDRNLDTAQEYLDRFVSSITETEGLLSQLDLREIPGAAIGFILANVSSAGKNFEGFLLANGDPALVQKLAELEEAQASLSERADVREALRHSEGMNEDLDHAFLHIRNASNLLFNFKTVHSSSEESLPNQTTTSLVGLISRAHAAAIRGRETWLKEYMPQEQTISPPGNKDTPAQRPDAGYADPKGMTPG
jgi:hypothetical protein